MKTQFVAVEYGGGKLFINFAQVVSIGDRDGGTEITYANGYHVVLEGLSAQELLTVLSCEEDLE